MLQSQSKIDELVDYLDLLGCYRERKPSDLEVGAYGRGSRFFFQGGDRLVIYYDIFAGSLGELKSHYHSEHLRENRIWRKTEDGFEYQRITDTAVENPISV